MKRSIAFLVIAFNFININSIQCKPTLFNSVNNAHKPPDSRTEGFYPDSISGSLDPSSCPHDSLDRSDHPGLQSHPAMTDGSPNPSDLHDTASKKNRVARNGKNSDEFLKRLTSLARLYNAISLQSELMNGTKTVEKAISQMLSIGLVEISDFIAYSNDHVTKLIETMESVRDSLRSSASLENVILLINDVIATYGSIGSVSDFPSTEAFSGRMNDLFKALGNDGLENGLSSLKEILQKLNVITALDASTMNKLDAVNEYYFVQNRVAKFKTDLDKLKEEIPSWKSFFDLGQKDSLKVLKPLQTFVRTLSVLERMVSHESYVGTDYRSYVEENFSELEKLLQVSKSAKSTFDFLGNLFKSRKVSKTQGFVDGVAGFEYLPHIFQDSWIVQALAHVGSENQIISGLKPIIQLNSKLSPIEAQLNQIANAEFANSFRVFESIQNLVTNLPEDFGKTISIIDEYHSCRTSNKTGSSSIKYEIKDAHKLQKSFSLLESSKFLDRDMNEIQNELENFSRSTKFSDLSDLSKAAEEVTDIHSRYVSSGSLEKMRNYMKAVLNKLEDFDAGRVKNYAETLSIFSKTAESFFAKIEVTNQISIMDCMKKLQDQSEVASNSIKIIQTLREFDVKHTDNVKAGLSAIPLTSNLLKNLGISSVLETMKTESTEHTEKLNEMPAFSSGTSTGSEILSVSTSLLRDSYELLKFENSVDKLDVEVDLENYYVPEATKDKIFIEDQWGDHRKDLKALKQGIESIKAFHSSINNGNATKFEDIGVALKNNSLGDISFHMAEKSAALDKLFKFNYNSKDKATHEIAKKTIDKIEALDLSFASHKAKLESAPGVLEHLQTFLTQFIEKIEASEALEADNTTQIITIVVCSIAGILSIGGAVTLYMGLTKKGCFKKVEHTKVVDRDRIIRLGQLIPRDQQYIWLMGLQFRDARTAYRFFALILHNIKVTDDNYPVNNILPATRLPRQNIQFKGGFPMNTHGYHGNKIQTRTGTVFYAMAGPTGADATHEDTQELFWDVVWNDMVEFIVMLNKIEEGMNDDNGTRHTILATYFPSMDPGTFRQRTITIGKYTITEISSTNAEHGDFNNHRDYTVRVLEITRTVGRVFSRRSESRRVTHYSFLNFEDDGTLRQGFQGMYEVMQIVKKSTNPIVVHCDTGTNRTMCFIGMEYIPCMVEVNDTLTYSSVVSKLADHRLRSFTTLRFSYTLQMAVIYSYLNRIDSLHVFDEFRRLYERVVLNGEGNEHHRDIEW